VTDMNESAARRDILRLLSLVLVFIGIIIAGYISYTKITDTSVVCLIEDSHSCDVVQSSVYAKLAGIDIAYLGLLAYLVLGALLLLEDRIALLQEYGHLLVFGFTLFAFVYAIWLVYVQAAILQAFCTWCLGHEVTMTLLFIVSALRLWRHLQAD
jgi:uncharacterized membrane protein